MFKFNYKLKHFFVLGLLVAVCTTAVYSQTIKQPTYNVGDTWTHRTIDSWTGKVKHEATQTVIGISGDFLRVNNAIKTLNSQTGQLSTPTLNDNTQRANFNVSYNVGGKVSTRINFDWPLEVGKKWSYEYTTASTNVLGSNFPQINFNYKANAEVVGFEEIETAAGKFKTIKVVHRTAWKESANNEGTQIMTYWFAPQAKRHVKYTFESFSIDGIPGNRETVDLISYTLAPM